MTYTPDEIKLWIARAGGFATSVVSHEACAEIALAQIEYNKMYGKRLPLGSSEDNSEAYGRTFDLDPLEAMAEKHRKEIRRKDFIIQKLWAAIGIAILVIVVILL